MAQKQSATDLAKKRKLYYELIIMTVLAGGLLLFLMVYFGVGGPVGSGIAYVLFGLFGVSAFLVPLYVMVGSAYKAFNYKNQRLNTKLFQSFFLLVVLAAFAHVSQMQGPQINRVIMGQRATLSVLRHYFKMSATHQIGGGFIGGLIGDLFMMALDRTGSFLILGLIIMALLILIFEFSLFEIIKFIYKYLKISLVFTIKHIKILKANLVESLQSQQAIRQKKQAELKDAKNLKATKEIKTTKDLKPMPMVDITHLPSEPVDQTQANESVTEAALADPVQMTFFEPKKTAKLDTETVATVEKEIFENVKTSSKKQGLYDFPPIELLHDNLNVDLRPSGDGMTQKAKKLQQTLESFGVGAKVVHVSYGPSVTRFEIKPDVGVKVNKILNLVDDISLALATHGVRIEAPIPGKSLIGIEVPNQETQSVFVKEIIDSDAFRKFPSKICFALGKDIGGDSIIANIESMPHLLISGATGSGKSVCINTLITSILYKANPDEVKLLMIDPKVVELKMYNGIPHLLIPVVTDPKKAAGALYWAVQEMQSRYDLFANVNVKDLKGFNAKVHEFQEMERLPEIVVIVDELADLMQVAAKEVEEYICRLAQMARAAGIHLILATQRPSVDVITGLIKANIPSRIAFSVSSGIDSRTIIDSHGAEKLVGKGDMLYKPRDLQKPIRVQGTFISEKEVESVVNFLKTTRKPEYDQTILEKLDHLDAKNEEKAEKEEAAYDAKDTMLDEVLDFVVEKQKASASMIQRRFRVGFTRAARMIDQLEESGMIGPEQGSKPRDVLITYEAYHQMKQQSQQVVSQNQETDASAQTATETLEQ